jgi:predicted helicase
MTIKPTTLFYSYAHEDEALRSRLNSHLALLRQQGLIEEWYDREILGGSLWEEEINDHLKAARVILLLISPSFLASEYCYSIEMQRAMERHVAGEARVLPIILRPCDWETAPFGKLQALPKDGRPVTTWSNRDQAFTDIAKGIRKVIDTLNGAPSGMLSSHISTSKKNTQTGEKPMPNASMTLTTPILKKALDRYYKELESYKGKADYELAVRTAFQNLLAETARHVSWTLIPEQTLPSGARPDGTLRDNYFARGYWEAKGPDKDLEREIADKIKKGYPLTNTIFENTKRAVLYQNKKRVLIVEDMSKANANEVGDLIRQFLTHTEPDIEHFETAVQEFKERIPELAHALLAIIEKEHKENKKFKAAFEAFAQICRSSLDPNISKETLNEMLVQHLLTERLFRTVFDNPDFVSRNVIACEIEKVIQALTSRSFNRRDFLKSLDRFYVAIESAAKGIENWSERQSFLNTVYERFFQGFAVKKADTHGIVYTPQEIVDFMCSSIEEVLQKEFGKSISDQGVQILDPATGTGNFIVNLMRNYIKRRDLKYKYQHDLFCNEIMLLPYYIASLNIEHEYYAKSGEYEPFEGICFADTLELAERQQLSLFVEENTERVKREKEADIMVVIGNPPYNAWQKSENDNNKNRKYPIIDERIKETYVKYSQATNRNALSDAYVKFFRWATDRLEDRDGIVCFVSNNGFLEGFAFDGFRKQLASEFTEIYHLDLGGNARKQGRGNVFGIMVGVGMTILVRHRNAREDQRNRATIFYYKADDNHNKAEKLAFLRSASNISNVEWQLLYPDERFTWITENLRTEFEVFLPIGTKEGKASIESLTKTLFWTYTNGVKTNRDNWVYDFQELSLTQKIIRFIDTYNGEVDRWKRIGEPIEVDDFVLSDDTKIKWSRDLKSDLRRKRYAHFHTEKIRHSLYRPYTKKYYFFDAILSQDIFLHPRFFPTPSSELENILVCVPGLGDRKGFGCLATNTTPNMDLAFEKVQCFPYYTYAEDGSNRRENITDWALKQFQAKYGEQVSKWDIFHYVYGMLHHPQYRERYAENLKRDLPHIPLIANREAFNCCVSTGKALMNLHLNYEHETEYKLNWHENEDMPFSWRVEKMRLTPDKTAIVVNESLTLSGIPPECSQYRLGNRSALEWVIDQYQVSTDKRSGIVSDPNSLDDEEYIVRLVGKVITVSVETVKLVDDLAARVRVEDWTSEVLEVSD